MKNILYIIMFACAAALGLQACGNDDKPSFDFSGDTEIRAFSLSGFDGVIDHQKATIVVTLPLGLDISSIAPDITVAETATVEPASGVAVNFTMTQSYIVSDKDVYRKYKVIIDQPKATFTRFAIGSAEGMIDETNKTIKVYVPIGTDLTSLVPSTEYTDGAVMTPAASTPIDFSSPVEYKLNYYDTDFIYTVTVVHGMTIWNGEDVLLNDLWAGGGAAGPDIPDNPKLGGANNTLKCMSILREKNNDPWAGAGLPGLSIKTAEYKKFSMMVLKNVAGNVQFEVQGTDSAGENSGHTVKQWYDGNLGEWQEMIFDMSGSDIVTITLIVVAIHDENTKENAAYNDQRMYWDQIIAIPNN